MRNGLGRQKLPEAVSHGLTPQPTNSPSQNVIPNVTGMYVNESLSVGMRR